MPKKTVSTTYKWSETHNKWIPSLKIVVKQYKTIKENKNGRTKNDSN